MIRKSIYTLFFISVILQSSCSRCDKIEFLGDYFFTSDDRNIVPYSGNETLTFKNQTGDSIMLSGAGRHLVQDRHYVLPEGETEIYCPEYYYNLYKDEVVFINNKDNIIQICLNKNKQSNTSLSISIDIEQPYTIYAYSNNNGYSANIIYCHSGFAIIPYDSLTII